MKQRIRLTEEDLHRIIENSVRKVIMENDEDESWLGDKFRQGARAARSFMGQGADGVAQDSPYADEPTYNWKGRFNAAKSGWREQGRMNGNNADMEVLNNLAQKFGTNTTIGQALNRLTMSNRGANGRITQTARRIYDKPTGF